MSRRHAAKALLATAAVSAVTVAGFGVLSQPSAAGAPASPDSICIGSLICIGSSSAAPTSTTPSPTDTSSATSTTSATSSNSPTDSGSSSGTSSGPTSSAPTSSAPSSSAPTSAGPSNGQPSTGSAAAKPKSVVNVTLSGLRIAQRGKNLVVRFTVTDTGTVAVGGHLITAHVSGYRTRAWLSNLPVGQPVQVTATWGIVHHHTLVRVLVQGDPRHQVKESDESDNTLSGSTRLR